MSKEKMSAKDKKFEEERAKYRSQIRELEREVKNEKIKNYQLREELEKKDSLLEEKDDWIRRLLEYTELTPEEMKKIIQQERVSVEMSGFLSSMMSVLGRGFI